VIRRGPQFTNRQWISIGAAVGTLIAVLIGSLVATAALSIHTTPSTPNSPSAAATIAATSATIDNLPTALPTATTAPDQPTPTVAVVTDTPQPIPTGTPFPTATPTCCTLIDPLINWNHVDRQYGFTWDSTYTQSFGRNGPSPKPTASGAYVEWHDTSIRSFYFHIYVKGANPPTSSDPFTFYTSVDEWTPGSATALVQWFPTPSTYVSFPKIGWKQWDYSVTVSGPNVTPQPTYVIVKWNSSTQFASELARMDIIYY
jgi:hypothetical protein